MKPQVQPGSPAKRPEGRGETASGKPVSSLNAPPHGRLQVESTAKTEANQDWPTISDFAPGAQAVRMATGESGSRYLNRAATRRDAQALGQRPGVHGRPDQARARAVPFGAGPGHSGYRSSSNSRVGVHESTGLGNRLRGQGMARRCGLTRKGRAQWLAGPLSLPKRPTRRKGRSAATRRRKRAPGQSRRSAPKGASRPGPGSPGSTRRRPVTPDWISKPFGIDTPTRPLPQTRMVDRGQDCSSVLGRKRVRSARRSVDRGQGSSAVLGNG